MVALLEISCPSCLWHAPAQTCWSLLQTKKASEYDNKQAHIELAMKMLKRDPLTAPNVGDRIPYVICRGPKDANMCDKVEDPMYVQA